MFPETKSRGTSGLESENWQCFSGLLSRHFPPFFDPACCHVFPAGYNCSSVSRSEDTFDFMQGHVTKHQQMVVPVKICYLYGFIESYCHHS